MLLPKFKCGQFFQRPDSIFNIIFRRQLYVSLIVNVIPLAHGIGVGWVSPTLLQLQSINSPVNFSISINEASWIGSIIAFGSISGNLILSLIIKKFGPKVCLYIMAIPLVISWIFVYFAQSVEYIYLARFLGGITSGSSFMLIALFISEISDKNMRGTFASFALVAAMLGILLGYILSSSLSYFVFPWVVIALTFPFFIFFSYFPQTPQQLLRTNRIDAALESFQFYRNYECNSIKCEQEFYELKSAIASTKSDTELTLSDFTTKPALKAFATCFVLLVLNQSSGLFAFSMYASEIFVISGTPFDPNTSTIMTGTAQLVGMLITTNFVDRFGRRVLLFFSTVCVVLGLVTFGCYTEFGELFLDTKTYNWIPLVLMIFIIFVGNVGLGPLTNIVMVEILPVKIRPTALSGAFICLYIIIFIVLKSFPLCLHYFGISITFWFCALITTIGLIYLVFFLQETNGKSIDLD